MQANIGVVIVTFNRLEKLKKTLTCFKEQDLSPKYVLVVNNNSSDGTKEFLETWKKDDNCQFKKMVIHEKENLGGSGGFHVGLEKAKEMDADGFGYQMMMLIHKRYYQSGERFHYK